MERWTELWRRIGAQGDPDAVYARLQELYSEPHRAYHTMEHISYCLGEFDRARYIPQYPDEVEMAIWFHDAIYNTRSSDNEKKSAQLAQSILSHAQVPSAFRHRIYDLVLATRHTEIPEGVDAQVLIDVDLSILGRPQEEFDEYERKVREEYSWVPEDRFREGRASILRRFLERPYIYLTDFFRQRYEDQARKNLERSLKNLAVI